MGHWMSVIDDGAMDAIHLIPIKFHSFSGLRLHILIEFELTESTNWNRSSTCQSLFWLIMNLPNLLYLPCCWTILKVVWQLLAHRKYYFGIIACLTHTNTPNDARKLSTKRAHTITHTHTHWRIDHRIELLFWLIQFQFCLICQQYSDDWFGRFVLRWIFFGLDRNSSTLRVRGRVRGRKRNGECAMVLFENVKSQNYLRKNNYFD